MDTVAQRRINRTVAHLNPQTPVNVAITSQECVKSLEKRKYDTTLRWNGYGYADTSFRLNEDGQMEFRGPKYDLHGQTLPLFRKWAETEVGFDVTEFSPSQTFVKSVHSPTINKQFMEDIKGKYAKLADDDHERIFHGHGHTVEEVFKLRGSAFDRLPDLVIYPGTHEQVVDIVKAADKNNVVLIPFGGGTSVTNALTCLPDEKRMIVSLDMRSMNKIKWINEENMTACIEAGAAGEYIEQELAPKGYTFGHEPDSYEFSTLGGWIATRASGMKKNIYGNIEDLLISCKLVTPTGVLENLHDGPRLSCGPDINELTIGSEGNFGVVTEAIVKIKRVPECTIYGAIAFPDFVSGFNALKEIAMHNVFPASIRLMDNEQFRLANALKPAHGAWTNFVDSIKKFYVTAIKGFDVNTLCAATLVFQGRKEEVEYQQRVVYEIAKKHRGMKADPESGRRGYMLTYMIAYIRDIVMDYSFVAESFETSVPYSKTMQLCDAVKKRIKSSCLTLGIKKPPFVCCRITQLYDNGCAVYFYFAINHKGLQDPVQAYLEIENDARDEILKQGGSISHHHGVGKLRAPYMSRVMSEPAIRILKAIKKQLDPNNVFAANNMGL